MRRVGRGLAWALCALLALAGVRGLTILATSGDDRPVASLRYLTDDLGVYSARMQRLFPEGHVFTASLTGLAWAHAARDPALHGEGLAGARRALEIVESPVARESFRTAGGLDHGMFYHAWHTRLLAAVVGLADDDPDEASRLATACRHLGAALRSTRGAVDSYPGQAWPADNVVGAAALTQCGRLVDREYTDVARAWLASARSRQDPATGLLPHATWLPDARGSSAALMTAFLAEIDPEYAALQHARLTDTFATRMAGVLPALREYRRGVDGPGDVDSGPLVLGASAPASVVGIAAARAVGDAETAAALGASSEALGLAISWGGRRRYLFGQLPVGDAFLAWARSIPLAAPAETSAFAGWRLRWGLASLLLLALGLAGGVRLWSSRPAAARSPKS